MSFPSKVTCWGAEVFEKWVNQFHENNFLFSELKIVSATLLKKRPLCEFHLFPKNMTTKEAETYTEKLCKYYIHLYSQWLGIQKAVDIIGN